VGQRVYSQKFTVGAGLIATQAVVLEDAQLDRMEIIIPDGHNGLTALQVQWSGVPAFPFGGLDPFLRGNDEKVTWDARQEVTANGFSLIGFNADIFDHYWLLRFFVSDLPATRSPISIASPQAAAAPTAEDASAVAALSGDLTDASAA
jgi:hypothetical protein